MILRSLIVQRRMSVVRICNNVSCPPSSVLLLPPVLLRPPLPPLLFFLPLAPPCPLPPGPLLSLPLLFGAPGLRGTFFRTSRGWA